MAKALSQDLRDRIVAPIDGGLNPLQCYGAFGLWLKRNGGDCDGRG